MQQKQWIKLSNLVPEDFIILCCECLILLERMGKDRILGMQKIVNYKLLFHLCLFLIRQCRILRRLMPGGVIGAFPKEIVAAPNRFQQDIHELPSYCLFVKRFFLTICIQYPNDKISNLNMSKTRKFLRYQFQLCTEKTDFNYGTAILCIQL